MTIRGMALAVACALALACGGGGSGGADPTGSVDLPGIDVDVPAGADAGAEADLGRDGSDEPGPADASDADAGAKDTGGETAADVPDAQDLPDVAADVAGEVGPDVADVPGDLPSDVDAPSDVAADTAQPDSQCGAAAALDPFAVYPLGDQGKGGDSVIAGDATVTFKGPADSTDACYGDPCQKVTLRFDDGTTQVLTYSLPGGLEMPVYLNERVHVYWKRDQPWWTDAVLVVWKLEYDWKPVFFFHDAAAKDATWYDCGGQAACPSVKQLPTDCPPVEETCGTFVHPAVELGLFGGTSEAEGPMVLHQGETAVLPGTPLHIRYLVARSYDVAQMECMDYPGTWTAAAVVRNVDVSQCRCSDDQDCRDGEVCASDIGRCVPSRCTMDSACMSPPGFCDAYTGACVTPDATCTTDADCPDGLCNPNLIPCTPDAGCSHPPVRACVKNLCLVADCAPNTECSGLLSACVKCASDCQCADYGRGGWCDNRHPGGECRKCDLAKVALSQPQVFDYFVFCVSKSALDLDALKAIDPNVSCQATGGGPAKCDVTTEESCMSDIPTTLKTHGLDDDAWARACAFADLPWVSRVAGGFWE